MEFTMCSRTQLCGYLSWSAVNLIAVIGLGNGCAWFAHHKRGQRSYSRPAVKPYSHLWSKPQCAGGTFWLKEANCKDIIVRPNSPSPWREEKDQPGLTLTQMWTTRGQTWAQRWIGERRHVVSLLSFCLIFCCFFTISPTSTLRPIARCCLN